MQVQNGSECTTQFTDEEKAKGFDRANRFYDELIESTESFSAISDEYGTRTLTDLIYLNQAIMKGTFIDHYPDESNITIVLRSLPSALEWLSYVKVSESTRA